MSSIWGDLDGPTPIQLTNNVANGEPITKPRIRQLVWDFLEKNNMVNFPRPVHKRIPNFKGAATAGQLLTSLPEFKNASVIKVNPDKPQEEVRYQVLDHHKQLLVPTPRLKSGLFNLMENPGNADKEEIRKLASRQGIDKHSKALPLFYNTKIDVVVIGSVAVDKLGHRIGKGEGFADLEFAMGKTMGAITDDTIVVATVHDCQLFDEFPEEIFGEHDVSVDLIVTPTIIWRVEKRLPKPSRVIWDILSPEKLKSIPVLKRMKAAEEKFGKLSALSEEEIDEENQVELRRVEANRQKNIENRESRQKDGAGKNRRDYSEERVRRDDRRDNREEKVRDDRNENRNYRQRDSAGKNRRDDSDERVRRDDRNENRSYRQRDGAEKNRRDYSEERDRRDDNTEEKVRRDDRNENRNYRQRDGAGKNRRDYSDERVRRDERLDNGNDMKSKERNTSRYKREDYSDDDINSKPEKRGRQKKQQQEDIFDDRPMLYVGKIPRDLRVRDLKAAIVENIVENVKTNELVWKGKKGYAFLYFDISVDIEEVFNSLKDMTIGDAVLDVQREKYVK